MKISKIRIKNFKIFEDTTVDFQSANLVMFDGPNGFGKTSLYDAIELLFTGKIRRFDLLRERLVDGRESYSEHPFYHENGIGDIIICIEFVKGTITYCIERIAKKEDIRNDTNFSSYKLFQKENFDSEKRSIISDEKVFLSSILGENYKENFQYLNYVEQEDCLYLLKDQDKTRKQHISYLFNVAEFESKIQKIDLLKRKIEELCTPNEDQSIKSLEKEIKIIKDYLAKEYSNTNFNRLFPEKDILWDMESVDFASYDFNDLIGENGIITKIRNLVMNKHEFQNYLHNQTIESLTKNEDKLSNFCLFNNFLPQQEALVKERNIFQKKKELIKRLNEFSINNLKQKDLDLDFADCDFLNKKMIDDFNSNYESLKIEIKELDQLEEIYSTIGNSRREIIENIETLKEDNSIVTGGTCFLCGYNWESIDTLLNKISLQSENLEKITTQKTKDFNEKVLIFKNDILASLVNSIDEDINKNKVDVEFIKQLLNFEEISFNDVLKKMKSLSFDYKNYLNTTKDLSFPINITQLISELNALKKEYDIEAIESYFNEIFEQYFDREEERLDKMGEEVIQQKSDYLKYVHSIWQNQILEQKTVLLSTKKLKYDNAKTMSSKLNALKKIYNESLKQYQKKVIKDIEIIFHIYSGRIMQDFQGGLGLFIFSDKNGIRFQSSPSKTFDAVFSMSSGQLSALIISFTLALHKKYSHNNILLIDDPVQTMDELNIVGFIELLRNEFRNNQIIVSTHEDMASAFMRYKFKNYNLNTKRINLKEELLETSITN